MLFLSFRYDYSGCRRGRKQWYLFCLVIFILVGGLRYRLGVDSIAYEEEYTYSLPSLSEFASFDFESTRYGRGFLLLAAIARSLSDSFVALQFLQAIFVNSIIFGFFYKYTRHCFFAIVLYFLIVYVNFTFEIMRESCAVVMFLIGWQYFLANKWVKYYVCAVIAVLFHPSALIICLFPIFYLPIFRPFFRFGKWFWLMVGIVYVISAVVSVKFFDLIRLVELADAQNYATSYENSDYYGTSVILNIKGFIALIVRSILYVYFAILLLRNKYVVKESKNREISWRDKLECMLCMSIYIMVISLFLKILFRFNNYTSPFIILAISEVMFSKFKLKTRIIKLSFACWMIFILPYMAIQFYGYLAEDRDSDIRIIRKYYPYESVLNPIKDAEREKLYRSKGR